jgi:hypothetical protein
MENQLVNYVFLITEGVLLDKEANENKNVRRSSSSG